MAASYNYRQQDIRTKFVAKATEKLASGLRINQAADDAAGLSISEKMRGQINGLAQAKYNIQAGISLLQTADAGMGEIANPNLVRLRELAIQAATDTVTTTERAMIQQEVTQILSAIDDIATRTHFNERPLLSNGASVITNPDELDKIVDVPAKKQVNVGEIIVPNPPKLPTLEIEAFFGTISGQDWPDLNIVAPNGEKFGYSSKFLNSGVPTQISAGTNGFSAAASAWYTGYTAKDEKMIFTNPIPGKWTIEIRNDGGNTDSTFTVRTNYKIEGGVPPAAGGETPLVKEPLILQTGPNSGNTMAIDLTDVTTSALQLTSLSMTTREAANQALAMIDAASQFVSQERARFGSYDNRLAYSEQNVSNYHEQLTKAESLLRDIDVAKEATHLQMQQVMLKAAQVIGIQTHQQANNILKLI